MTDNGLCIAVSSAADVKARQVYYNVPYEDMHAPAVGPAHPFNKDGLAAGMRNHRAGHVEVSHFCLPCHCLPCLTLCYACLGSQHPMSPAPTAAMLVYSKKLVLSSLLTM